MATFADDREALQRSKPRALEEVLADPRVARVAAAAATPERCPLGCRVLEAEKDYVTDTAP